MIHPLPPDYRRVSQPFGARPDYYKQWHLDGHEGIDLSCPVGTPVRAAHDGLVQRLYSPDTYGVWLQVWGDEVMTAYAHLSAVTVTSGQRVTAGTPIALSGNTGNSTGPHLHFGVCPLPRDVLNGYKGWENPAPYLQGGTMTKLAAGVQIWSAATEDHLKRALYPALKCLTGVDPVEIRDKVLPAYDRAGRPRPFIWPRKWTDDITADLVAQGAAGAKRWRDAVIADYAHWRNILGCDTVELDNETICQSDDDAKRHNEFEAELIRLLAQDGFSSIALNASVAWPKLEHWRHYRETLERAQYLGKHEYGWPANNAEGQDLRYFDWHVLRFRRDCQVIRDLGYRLPRLIITEVGWEGALVGIGHRGFRMLGDQGQYLDWLKWYDGEIQGDPRVAYASIFETGAQEKWHEMDAVGSAIDGGLADYVRDSYVAGTPPVDTALDAERKQLDAMLAVYPATKKACLERGYHWGGEAYSIGDRYARCWAWKPSASRYVRLWLDSRTWKVVREEVLSGPQTL
jgi:hypothetical protein